MTENSINLEVMLKSHLPIIFELLNEQKLTNYQWKKLNRNFIRIYEKRKKEYFKNNEYLLVKSNIYDLITSSIKGELKATMLLAFIKKTLEELTDNLSISEKKKLRTTVYNLLVSFDSKYYNYLGELLILNNLLRSKDYYLSEIESKIVNKKTADFLIKKRDDTESHLIEVVNVHVEDAHIDLDKLLTDKLVAKLNDKRDGETTYLDFKLVPVIWTSYENLRRVENLYKNGFSISFESVWEPTAFAMFTYPENRVIYRFGNISTLFSIMEEDNTFVVNNS